jgi:hypothetical protein
MRNEVKGTIIGVIFVLMFALGGGVGVAVLIVRPFDFFVSIFVGGTFIVSAIVCWWWSCFVREIYRRP